MCVNIGDVHHFIGQFSYSFRSLIFLPSKYFYQDKEKETGGGDNEEAERKAADSSSDDDRPVNNGDNGLSSGKLMSDFDMMLERKRDGFMKFEKISGSLPQNA